MPPGMLVAGLGRQHLERDHATQENGREQALAECRHGLSCAISQNLDKAPAAVSPQL